jgi:glycosyltransferase involved in cell wall biosynthesis/2-polyprenyl-3-methyl-5-hydroxy-6-metoxy-1,4-benzoquinol methylase
MDAKLNVTEGTPMGGLRPKILARSQPKEAKMECVYDKPEYWCGPLGYRPGSDGKGYKDFNVNHIRVNYIKKFKPENVLDIGCAMGFLVGRLRKLGIEATGMDISKYAIEHSEVKPYLKQHDISKPWPYADQSVDLVVSFATLEHLTPEECDRTIKEIARVAKRAIVSVGVEGDEDFDGDTTHKTKRPLQWWVDQFKKYMEPVRFVIMGDSKAEWLAIHRGYLTNKVGYRGMWVQSYANLDDTILDVGCDDNPIWKGTAFKVTTCDVNMAVQPDMVCDAASVPRTDKSFDIVSCCELLEHVPDPLAVLKEAVRLARKKIIITVPNEYEWPEELKPFKNAEHRRHYTKETLTELLETLDIPYSIESFSREGWAHFGAVVNIETPSPIRVLEEKTPVSKGLKIAIVSSPMIAVPPKGYGGLERVVYDLAVALGKDNDVTLFAADESFAEGCKVVTYGLAAGTVQCNWLDEERKSFLKIKDQLKGFDIIHDHTWFGLVYGLRQDDPKVRICHTHHGGLNQEWWGTSKPPFPLNLISISQWMAKVYGAQGFTARPIYNGISMEKYAFQENKGDRLMFVGRCDSFKQPHVAIEVAKQLGLGIDMVCGTFVQDKNYLEAVKSLCVGDIRWVEDPPQDEKVKLIQNAKCLLFPSHMGEPFGLVAAEAMACGTPVVALNDGAISEVVGDCGFVVDVPYPETKDYASEDAWRPAHQAYIKTCGEKLGEKVKLIGGISPKACRDRVEGLFSREIMAKNYEVAYRDILAGREW